MWNCKVVKLQKIEIFPFFINLSRARNVSFFLNILSFKQKSQVSEKLLVFFVENTEKTHTLVIELVH